MTDWTAGYRADIEYTHGYYFELNPIRVKFALTNAGILSPEIKTACELGFGQGVSINLHTAASGVDWYGTDFNPSQAAFARDLAHTYSDTVRLYDESFEEFCARKDLPDFDYIALHGIWSWISENNRHVLVNFLRRKLKVGGVVYISYNTMPGWAAFAPVRDLLNQHARVIGAKGGGAIAHVESALNFAERLFDLQPLFGRSNPQIPERLRMAKAQSRQYLAHEYFNQHWYPMSIEDMGTWLQAAKLNFACSATYTDHIDALHLTAQQQQFLQEIPDTMMRESVRDFMFNQQFRRDCWIKGARTLTRLEQQEILKNVRVMLAVNRTDVTMKINGVLGEIPLNENIYAPILDLLSKHEVLTLGYMQKELASKNISSLQLLQAVMILGASLQIVLVQEDNIIASAQKNTEKLNAHLMSRARTSGEVSHLASPVVGGGVAVGRFEQLFIQALKQGKQSPDEWAAAAWTVLNMQGQKLLVSNKTLDTAEENLAELKRQAHTFSEKRLHLMKVLKVA